MQNHKTLRIWKQQTFDIQKYERMMPLYPRPDITVQLTIQPATPKPVKTIPKEISGKAKLDKMIERIRVKRRKQQCPECDYSSYKINNTKRHIKSVHIDE